MAPDARPGVKRMYPNGLVEAARWPPTGRSQVVGEHGQLVDEGDVDVAERVLSSW